MLQDVSHDDEVRWWVAQLIQGLDLLNPLGERSLRHFAHNPSSGWDRREELALVAPEVDHALQFGPDSAPAEDVHHEGAPLTHQLRLTGARIVHAPRVPGFPAVANGFVPTAAIAAVNRGQFIVAVAGVEIGQITTLTSTKYGGLTQRKTR